jgi:ectoine hydroxylase-related dioxygenase (phytanoyl-CoA dioxygenase family)
MKVYDASDAPSFDLRRDGVVLIPGAVSQEAISGLQRITDAEYDRLANPDSDVVRDIASSSASWGGIAIDHVKSLAPDPKKAVALVDQSIGQLNAALRKLSVADPVFQSSLSYVRRHRNSATFAPWHLDAHAAGTINHDPVFNAWMPLVAVGQNCPGLEFIVGAHQRTRAGNYAHQDTEHPADAGYPTPSWIAENSADGKHVCFVMAPGDVIIFDHWTPHRTQVSEFPPYVRTSAEMRFSARRVS